MANKPGVIVAYVQRMNAAARDTFRDSRVRIASSVALAALILWLLRADLRALLPCCGPGRLAATLYGFRIELSGLLQRLKRVGATGAEFSEVSIVAQITATPVDQALRAVAPNEVQPPYIQLRVTALRPELNAREPDDHGRREHLLMLRLAEAQQTRDWQAVWLTIFSSQLEALTAMAGVVGPIDLSPYYDSHIQRRDAQFGVDQPQFSCGHV